MKSILSLETSGAMLNLLCLASFVNSCRGVGLFVGIELVKNRETREPATAEAQHVIYRYLNLIKRIERPESLNHSTCRLKQQRILFSADGPDRNVLKAKPPMCFSKANVDQLLDAIDAVLFEMESGELDTSAENTKKLMYGSANGPKIIPSSEKRTSSSEGMDSNLKKIRH
jgi:ethanolamine-phosphate phospho-lyase